MINDVGKLSIDLPNMDGEEKLLNEPEPAEWREEFKPIPLNLEIDLVYECQTQVALPIG